METWKKFRHVWLSEIIRRNGRQGMDENKCPCTNGELPAPFRCCDCFLAAKLVCATCMMKSHEQAPFHRIEVWLSLLYSNVTNFL